MDKEFAGKKALIIDDEADMVKYLETFLQDLGFETVSAPDAIEGTELARSEKPSVITLDVSMPEMSGGKFLKELQSDPEIADIPVIIITGVAADYKGFIHGRKFIKPPAGYVEKPIDREKLTATLREVLA